MFWRRLRSCSHSGPTDSVRFTDCRKISKQITWTSWSACTAEQLHLIQAATIHRRLRQWQQRALALPGARRGLLHKLPDTPAAAPSSLRLLVPGSAAKMSRVALVRAMGSMPSFRNLMCRNRGAGRTGTTTRIAGGVQGNASVGSTSVKAGKYSLTHYVLARCIGAGTQFTPDALGRTCLKKRSPGK